VCSLRSSSLLNRIGRRQRENGDRLDRAHRADRRECKDP
jgi:hypothetical protein